MRYWVTGHAIRYYDLQTPIEANSEEEAAEKAQDLPFEWWVHSKESESSPRTEVDLVELEEQL